jgi:hypothetical protein
MKGKGRLLVIVLAGLLVPACDGDECLTDEDCGDNHYCDTSGSDWVCVSSGDTYDGPRSCTFTRKFHINCNKPDDPPDKFEPGCVDGVGNDCDLAILQRTSDTDGVCNWSKSYLYKTLFDGTCKEYWAQNPDKAKQCVTMCGD